MSHPVLRLASHLVGAVALARRRWYASHPGARRRLDRPVVSVGNLSVGGTGKTPLVGALARLLVGMGERPAVLSRGYARERPREGVVVVSDGSSVLAGVAESGDEPFMLARAVPQAAVLVCADRFAAGHLAEHRLGCTVHLLDDGFQHLRLARDVDLLIVSHGDLDYPHPVPLGRLREPIAAAAAADAVLVASGEPITPAQAAAGLHVAHAFGLDRAIGGPRVFPGQAETEAGTDAPVSAPGPVFAVAGIARPERFFGDLGAAGWTLAGTRAFRDHHRFTEREVADLRRAAQEVGARAVLTTEKDMVRLDAAGASLTPGAGPRIPFLWVPLQVTLDPSFAPWLRDRLTRARRVRAA